MPAFGKFACLILVLLCQLQAGSQTVAADGPKVIRNVTPQGVTPGPQITAPLKRIPGIEPAPPEVRTRNLYRIRVLDTATYEGRYLGRVWRVELPGVEGIKRSETCVLEGGNSWPCGEIITRNLQKYIRLSAFKCAFAWQPNEEPLEISCSLRGEDISQTVLSRGWARAAADTSEALSAFATVAKDNAAGIYQTPSANWLGFTSLTRHGNSNDLPPPPNLPTLDVLGPLGNPLEDPQVSSP